MATRDRVKTMVLRAHSTLDSHPEVKQRRATQFFPASGQHKVTSLQLMTGLVVNFPHTTHRAPHISSCLYWSPNIGFDNFTVIIASPVTAKEQQSNKAETTSKTWPTTYTYKCIRLLTRVYIASYPGSRWAGERESLVSTVCACA